MDGRIRTLPLAGITADHAINPRADGVKDSVVSEYAENAAAGDEFPPLVVYRSAGGTYWLSEGFHRHAAYLKAGVKKAACEVRVGERRDALANACGSNLRHGLRRTNADKRRAVELLLAEFPDWSNPRVAEGAGVSVEFVRKVRPTGPGEIRVGADGKTRPAEVQPATVAGSICENPSKTADSAPKSREENGRPATGQIEAGTEKAGDPETPATEIEPVTPAAVQPEPADYGADFVRHVEALCRDMDQIAARMKALKKSEYAYSIHVDSAVSQVEAARKTLWQGRPAHTCPYCKGSGCRACVQTGRVKKATYDSGVEAVGVAE